MKRILIALFVCLGLALAAFGQEAPLKKKGNRFIRGLLAPWKDPKLLGAMALQATAMSADYYTTAHIRDICPSCKEQSPLGLLGDRPSNRKLIIIGLGGWVGQVYLVKFEKDWSLRETKREGNSRFETAFFNGLWYTHPAVMTLGHAFAAKANSNLNCPSGMQRTVFGCKFK